MDLDDVLIFFNDELPCPGKIKNCKELRTSYLNELDAITKSNCQHCSVIQLRDKFVKLLQSQDK